MSDIMSAFDVASRGGGLVMETYGHLRQEHSAAQAAKVLF